MPVMDVGEVGVRMRNGLVPVRVRMRLLPVPIKIVNVLMMLIMPVTMGVLQYFVGVNVLVAFAKMKHTPNAINPAATQNSVDGTSGHSENDSATPNSGATKKYAPVRAVPRFRRATTNKIRLTP